MLESVTRHVVEQIELARDFDACEGEGAEYEAARQRPHLVEGKQDAADHQVLPNYNSAVCLPSPALVSKLAQRAAARRTR
jgi:hypothetical protein